MPMSRLQRWQKLRSIRVAPAVYMDSPHTCRPLHALRTPSLHGPRTVSNRSFTLFRDMPEETCQAEPGNMPSFDSPPAHRRSSDRMWTPERGIVFSKSPNSAAKGSLTRAVSDSQSIAAASSHLQRSWSNSSLESLGRDYRTRPGQSSAVSPPVNRVRSNDELRVAKTRRRPGTDANRQFATTAKLESTQRQPGNLEKAPRTDDLPSETTHNVLESVTLLLRHWMGLLFGLPTLSLSFAGSGKLTTIWQTVFGSPPDTPLEPSAKHWTYKLDAQATGVLPKVKLCTDKAMSDKVAAEFLNETVLGFDLEWEICPSSTLGPKRNVSLVQVAKKDLIALFHIARFPEEDNADLMPPNLKLLIENASILKTGVNIAGDCTRLRKHFNVDPKGIFELSHMYRLVKYHNGPVDSIREINKKLVSLTRQVEDHLGRPLCKDLDVRAGAWSRPLSAQQTLYAASDAYACYRLFQTMDEKRSAIDPSPPRPAAYERKQPIRLANGQTVVEYLADQRVDEDIVQEVIRTDSESDSADEFGLDVEASESESASKSSPERSHPKNSPDAEDSSTNRATPLSSADEQLLYAAGVFAEENQAKLEATSKAKPLRRQLQAYHLWYAKSLPTTDAGRLLLIKPSSVACYVLEAIAVAKLPYNAERVEKEILPKVPPRVRRARFWMFETHKKQQDIKSI